MYLPLVPEMKLGPPASGGLYTSGDSAFPIVLLPGLYVAFAEVSPAETTRSTVVAAGSLTYERSTCALIVPPTRATVSGTLLMSSSCVYVPWVVDTWLWRLPLESSPVSRPTPNTMTFESRRSPWTSPSVLTEGSVPPAWKTTTFPCSVVSSSRLSAVRMPSRSDDSGRSRDGRSVAMADCRVAVSVVKFETTRAVTPKLTIAIFWFARRLATASVSEALVLSMASCLPIAALVSTMYTMPTPVPTSVSDAACTGDTASPFCCTS